MGTVQEVLAIIAALDPSQLVADIKKI